MSGSADIRTLLGIVADGTALSEDQAAAAFDVLMAGDATPAQIGGLLMALRVRGETVGEIAGAARAMRARATAVAAPAGAIDTCGTGGDGSGSLNISTGASFVVAACGVPVAKHGNRALTSRTGAADVLAALGVNIDAPLDLVRESLWENNLCFLMAPRHHSAMRHVAGPRAELAVRTIFNLLGPLSNPAGVRRQLVGVFDRAWIAPLAAVLGRLGLERAWVVHGEGGLDEMTTTGVTWVAELRDGAVSAFELAPEDAGLPRAAPADIAGGDPADNAAAMRAMLAGAPGAFRDTVLFSAGGALTVAGRTDDVAAGVAMARAALDDGRALAVLERLIEITNRTLP